MNPPLWQQLQLKKSDRVLIYGIGNEGRQDDGIGVRLINQLEVMQDLLPKGWGLDANYQLNAEVALQISDYEVVLFLDASRKVVDAPFYLEEISPTEQISFSTHAMNASSILGLCEQLYSVQPRCFWLGVPGEHWEFGENMSEKAQANMSHALTALQELVRGFDHAETAHA